MYIDVFLTVNQSNMDAGYLQYINYFGAQPVPIMDDETLVGFHCLVKQGFYNQAKVQWPNKIYLWQDAPAGFRIDSCIKHEFGSGQGIRTCADPETEDGTGIYNFKALKVYAKNILGDSWRKVAASLLAELTQKELDELTPAAIEKLSKNIKAKIK